MTTFVLVHGAFRGGWSWIRVRGLLEARGHQVWTPSLAGAAERARGHDGRVRLSDWATEVADLLHYNDLTRVALAGHSQGGLVVAAAADLATPRIARLCYLDAAVPAPGTSLVDSLPPDAPLPEPDTWLPPVPPRPGGRLDAATAAWIAARLTPSPAGPAYDPLPPADPQAPVLPRSYAFCTGTPPTYPCAITRRRLDAEGIGYRWLDADHEAPLTAPEHVAAWLTAPQPTAG
ncbi:esterase/lipase family protein [Yinghuangia sp. YIM S09857]|uniref:esterase/lipase family protein n=1 Tax=Yinghuangia sp. YIM S09857 TaxID=3436929 RepID=UPI003F52D8BE